MWRTQQPVNQVPAHWSKDFVEHLRTVHFGLLAVSAGLILLLLSARRYDRVTALVQVEEIIQLKNSWSPRWIETYGKRGTIGPDHRDKKGLLTGVSLYNRKAIDIRIVSGGSKPKIFSFWMFDSRYDTPMPVIIRCRFPNEDWFSLDDGWSPSEFPKTLDEFRTWWTALAKPKSLEEVISVASDGSGYGWGYEYEVILEESDQDKRLPHFEATMKLAKSYTGSYLLTLDDRYSEEAATPGQSVRFAPNITLIPIQTATTFAVSRGTIEALYRDLRVGEYSDSFADLSSAASVYSALPLEETKDFLHEEAAKGQEVFEAFGMKFPASRVTLWEEVLILCVQLYFFIYLRQLSGRLRADDPGWDVPWVGMDTSQLGQIILFVSLIVLPIAAMALLGGSSFPSVAQGSATGRLVASAALPLRTIRSRYRGNRIDLPRHSFLAL